MAANTLAQCTCVYVPGVCTGHGNMKGFHHKKSTGEIQGMLKCGPDAVAVVVLVDSGDVAASHSGLDREPSQTHEGLRFMDGECLRYTQGRKESCTVSIKERCD